MGARAQTPTMETHIGAEGFRSQKVNEGEQMGNITDGEKLVRTEQDVLKAQQIPLFTSNRSLVTDVPDDREENVGSIDSDSISQSSSATTQYPTLSKSIDLESDDDPMKLRKVALRNMALAGFPLCSISDLLPADERPGSSTLPPPDLPFYSKLKPISPARRALMRDMMEETRRTLHYNPYTLVNLGKEPNLGLPMIYLNAVYEPSEYDLEKEPDVFREQSYECVG